MPLEITVAVASFQNVTAQITTKQEGGRNQTFVKLGLSCFNSLWDMMGALWHLLLIILMSCGQVT